jgi:NAD(P)-dependent dehydrogenase (short-subunit alcohol dehydrogenase family)
VLRPDTTKLPPNKVWEESVRVNAVGLHSITRAFGDAMAARGSGSIVNIGSIYGMVGPTFSFYEGTSMPMGAGDYLFNKGGMINLTRYFAAVYGPRGVRVNCVSPGGFFNNQPKLFLERYNRKTFLGRMAGTRDLGGPVVFLLADASGYVTGTNLPVDGGFTAQ